MIQPGLERISQLVKYARYRWKSIHVAGTNGKGSICHLASSLLTGANIRCGKFTSPHLVDRWDCISINEQPVNVELFHHIEQHYIQLDRRMKLNASPFEILTATAFHIFDEEKVEIGVVEVGMGGKLDATNILNNQAVSVISRIALDHQNFLGTTLEEIARHKAGILRKGVPYIVNPENEWNIHDVIDKYAKEIGAGPRFSGNNVEFKEKLFPSEDWRTFAKSLQPFQKDNAVLACVAVKRAMEYTTQGYVGPAKLGKLLLDVKENPGRCQRLKVRPIFGSEEKPDKPGRSIVVDGAHNPDAAQALNMFLTDTERSNPIKGKTQLWKDGYPITWVLAMTEGKDARRYLEILLKPYDSVITTTFSPVAGMPWVKPMDPKELLKIAYSVQPDITGLCMTKPGPLRALAAAKYFTEEKLPIVLTGSLYLVGDFFRELRPRQSKSWFTDSKNKIDRENFRQMHEEERTRAHQALSMNSKDTDEGINRRPQAKDVETDEKQKLQKELLKLDRELERLEEEHTRAITTEPSDLEPEVSTTPTQDEADKVSDQKDPKLFQRKVGAPPQSKPTENPGFRILKQLTGPPIIEQEDPKQDPGNKSTKIVEQDGPLRNSGNEPTKIADGSENVDAREFKIHMHPAKLSEGDRADGHPLRQRLATTFMGPPPKAELETGEPKEPKNKKIKGRRERERAKRREARIAKGLSPYL